MPSVKCIPQTPVVSLHPDKVLAKANNYFIKTTFCPFNLHIMLLDFTVFFMIS